VWGEEEEGFNIIGGWLLCLKIKKIIIITMMMT